MFRNIRAAIFDMDGVLVDSEPLHIRTDAIALAHFGVELDPETFRGYTGMDNHVFFHDMCMKYGLKASPDEVLEYKNALLLAIYENDGVPLVPRAAEMMSELRGGRFSGIRFAIASSSGRAFVDCAIRTLDIGTFLSCSVSGDDVRMAKPDPEIFLKTAGLIGVEPGECLVLEDSRNGIEAARNAGMHVVGYYNPLSGNQDLSKADVVIESLLEFPDILGK